MLVGFETDPKARLSSVLGKSLHDWLVENGYRFVGIIANRVRQYVYCPGEAMEEEEEFWRRSKKVYEDMKKTYVIVHGKDLPPDVRDFVENAERLEWEEVGATYREYKEKGLIRYDVVFLRLEGIDMPRALFKLMKVFGPPTNSVSPDFKGVFDYRFRYKGDYFYVADIEGEDGIELDVRMEVPLPKRRKPTEEETRRAEEFASKLRRFIEVEIPIPYECFVYRM